VLGDAGLPVPAGSDLAAATTADRDPAHRFLREHGAVVVKPARGEQGQGITCNVTSGDALDDALDLAASVSRDVVLEEHVEGDDLRVLVIDGRVVAAAVRRPPEVAGTGDHTIRELVQRLSRRRAAQTDGEAEIPVDEVTRATVEDAGHDLDEVLAAGVRLRVRDAANLHQGGTLHDVTEDLHPDLVRMAEDTAEVLDIPVVGVDLLVDDPTDPTTAVVIEANERPGLANHEPQPTAAAFLDLLFPATAVAPHRATAVHDREEPRVGD
jgi:GNAT-family acetyltransferase (TIGR03103 family)